MDMDGKDMDINVPKSHRQPEVGPVSADDCRCSGEALGSEIEKLAQERDAWKSKAESYWDQFLRARAEMESFRKRTERDIQQRIGRGKSDLILSLLDVLDNFDRFLLPVKKRQLKMKTLGLQHFSKEPS